MMIAAGVLLLVNLVTFVTYGLDKRAAIRGARRVPEKRLHLLALVGGFPGAFAGQQVFRHKRAKRSFMVAYWAIVALHVVGWGTLAYLLLRPGAA
jgi:uncharacterized membrane protein YsdA (DUF1294 family)